MIEFKDGKLRIGSETIDFSYYPDAEKETLELILPKLRNALEILVTQLSPAESDNRCYAKDKAKGLPTFTLIATDPTAPKLIMDWVNRNHQVSEEKKVEDHRHVVWLLAPTYQLPTHS